MNQMRDYTFLLFCFVGTDPLLVPGLNLAPIYTACNTVWLMVTHSGRETFDTSSVNILEERPGLVRRKMIQRHTKYNTLTHKPVQFRAQSEAATNF